MQEGPQTEVSGSSVKVAFSTSLALRVYLILEAVSNPGGKGLLNIRAKDLQVARWLLPFSEVSSYFFDTHESKSL